MPSGHGFPAPGADGGFIAIDEWAYSRLPANMKQTLGNALAFHEMFLHTHVIQMAGHTMATSVLDFNPNEAALNATGLLFKLYREHVGTTPVAVDGNSSTLPPTRPGPGGAAQARPNAGSPHLAARRERRVECGRQTAHHRHH